MTADAGGAILKNEADNDLDIQLSATGGVAPKKKRLAREDRSRITNLGDGLRSDTDGVETSILGRRPQPIATSGRKIKKHRAP